MIWKDNISIEFFPPQTDAGKEKLRATGQALKVIHPKCASVTYGAGGSTQDTTLQAVHILLDEGFSVAPHLSCIGGTVERIEALLRQYREIGVRHLVALRGDLPSGSIDPGDFLYASELVEFIRKMHGDWFEIKVAAYPEFHPQAASPMEDVDNFCKKIRAGADEALTQYFYNPDAYEQFVDECQKRGITAPIVPGIMPIINYERLVRFSDACGAEIPRWLRLRLSGFDEKTQRDDLNKFSADVVANLCEKLLKLGAPGLHFYTMNQSEPILDISERIGLVDEDMLKEQP